MKYFKISVFITILSLFFIGIPQFNSNALIYNEVDYRILETGTPMEITGNEFNPIVINETYGGNTIGNWLNYMKINGLWKIELQAPELSTLYFWFGEGYEHQISSSVYKIELYYDTGYGYYYMGLFGLNQQMLMDYITLAYNDNAWEVPTNTRILTDINFQSNQDIYNNAYKQGYDDAWDEATPIIDDSYDDGYDYGYDTGMNDYAYNDNGNLITGNNAFLSGYQKGIQESGDTKANIINFIPGVLGAIFMFFFQIGQIGILGITIIDVLGILVLISGLIFVIKFFF